MSNRAKYVIGHFSSDCIYGKPDGEGLRYVDWMTKEEARAQLNTLRATYAGKPLKVAVYKLVPVITGTVDIEGNFTRTAETGPKIKNT